MEPEDLNRFTEARLLDEPLPVDTFMALTNEGIFTDEHTQETEEWQKH